jgi:hypothetical protein
VLTDNRYLLGITFTHFAQLRNNKAEHIASAVEVSLSTAYLTTLFVSHYISSNEGCCPTICVQRLRRTTTKVIIVGVSAKIWTENLRIQVRSINANSAELLIPFLYLDFLQEFTRSESIVGVPAKIWTENLRIQVRSITANSAELLFLFCSVISCRNLPVRSQFWISIGHWALLRNLQLKEKGNRKKEGERHCLVGFIPYVTESALSGNINFDTSGSLLHFAITTFVYLFFLLFLPIFE